MKSPEPDDQRNHHRIPRTYVMRVAVDSGNPWPNWSHVTTNDVSAGGALFIFDQSVKEGQRLFIKLHFLDRLIECTATVLRFTPGFQKPLVQVAVTFEWENEKDRQYVEDFSKRVRGQK